MNITAFSCTYWHNAAMAQAKAKSLNLMADRIEHYFHPHYWFLACGTFSEPHFNPLAERGVTVINSGLTLSRPYNIFNWHYSLAAFTAAAWNIILNVQPKPDLIINLDAEVLVGTVDFKALIDEFMRRPELVATPGWNGYMDTGWMAWKPAGIVWFAHSRRCPNLIEEGNRTLLHEQEMAEIFKDKWWNPWPQFRVIRQDYAYQPNPPSDDQVMNWPFVANPSSTLCGKYPITPATPL